MRIALAQMIMTSDIRENYEKTLRLICQAAEQKADLICFPEIQLSPFFPQYPEHDAGQYAIAADSSYIVGLCSACREHRIFASPNLYIEENGRRYDMSLLIDDHGRIIGRQKMVHIAQCEHFYEQDYYTPSEEGFAVFETRHGKIGIVVCFDRHYPESVRTEALRGAELILIPTANTTAEPSELFQWEIRVQAFQNSVNIAMCNRVGTEGDMTFSGESLIVSSKGDIVRMGGNTEELLVADVYVPEASVVRKSKPYTSLRRRELYE